jgi:hypothetical protein
VALGMLGLEISGYPGRFGKCYGLEVRLKNLEG